MNQQTLEQRLFGYADRAHRAIRELRKPSPAAAAGYASWGRRALAVAFDFVCYTALSFVGFLFVASPILRGFGKHPGTGVQLLEVAVIALFMFAPLFLISPWLLAREGKHNGQTFGKRTFGIRVVRDDGRPWTFRTALWRQLVLKGIVPIGSAALMVGVAEGVHALSAGATAVTVIIDCGAFLWLLVFALWPLRDSDRRGLHDRWAHSHVVRVSE